MRNWINSLSPGQLVTFYVWLWCVALWLFLGVHFFVKSRRRRHPMATRRRDVLPAPDPLCVVRNLREPN